MSQQVDNIKSFFNNASFAPGAYKAYLRQMRAEDFVLSFLLLKGEKILRTRINDDCKFVTNISGISYPPSDKARTDRASLEGYPMFYGSVFTHSNKENNLPRLVSHMETSNLMKDANACGREMVTQSLWMNNRDLKLAMLPVSAKYEMPSDELKSMIEDFRRFYTEGIINRCDDAIFLGNLFANENKSNTYEMTANYVDYLLNESTMSEYFDGVVYPSVPSKGLGMNICIKRSLIDDGIVQCKAAHVAMLTKVKMNAKLAPLFEGDIFPKGEIKWRNSEQVNMAIESPKLFEDLFYL